MPSREGATFATRRALRARKCAIRLWLLRRGLAQLPPPSMPPSRSGLVVDEARLGDAARMAELARSTFAQYAGLDAPPTQAIHAATEDMVRDLYGGGAVVAWLDGVAIGFFSYAARPGFLRGRLLAVDERYQGRGIGQALILGLHRVASIDGYPHIRGATGTEMTANRQIYEHIGLQVVGTAHRGSSVLYHMPIVPRRDFVPAPGARVDVFRAMRREHAVVCDIEQLAGLPQPRPRNGRAGQLRRGALVAFSERVAIGSIRYEVAGDQTRLGRLAVIPGARDRGVEGTLVATARALPEVAQCRRIESVGFALQR